ncbi:flippase [Phormidesmis sp. 146-12]
MTNRLSIITQRLSPNLLKILGNATWLFCDKILRMAIGLVVGVWVARYLEPQQFGLYNYAFAFSSIFNSIANLGLDGIIIRNIVREPECKDETLGTALILKLVAQLLAILVAVSIILILRPQEAILHWLVAIFTAGMLFESFYVIDFWFQSQTQSKYSIWAKNIALVAANLLRVLLIYLHASLTLFALSYLVEASLSALGLLSIYRLQGNLIRAWRFSTERAVELLKDSWTLILSSFVIMIYMRTDQIMIGQMRDDAAVGIYSAAVRVSELWYFIPLAITSSIFPALVQAKQKGSEIYFDRLQKVLDWLSALGYAIALIVSLSANQIVTLLYGESYAEAGVILSIHIWSGLFVSLGVVRTSWTTVEGYMSFAFLSTAIGAGVNVILNYFFIRLYGGVGAAISTLIAQCFAAYIATAFFAKTRAFFGMQTKALIIPSALYRISKSIKSFCDRSSRRD